MPTFNLSHNIPACVYYQLIKLFLIEENNAKTTCKLLKRNIIKTLNMNIFVNNIII